MCWLSQLAARANQPALVQQATVNTPVGRLGLCLDHGQNVVRRAVRLPLSGLQRQLALETVMQPLQPLLCIAVHKLSAPGATDKHAGSGRVCVIAWPDAHLQNEARGVNDGQIGAESIPAMIQNLAV